MFILYLDKKTSLSRFIYITSNYLLKIERTEKKVFIIIGIVIAII
jgi:hypothetical protein